LRIPVENNMAKKTILPWETKLAALRKFRDLEGNSNVPQAYADPDTGFRLGRWVATLRQRMGFLNEKQLRDLDELGFVWHRYKIMPWDAKLELLKKYKAREGDTLVSRDYMDPESGFRLGGWVDRVRQTKGTLSNANIQDLEQLGFVWNAYEKNWDVMFQLLQDYKREHHHSSPRSREEFRDRTLGQWVAMQRHMYSRRHRGIQYDNVIMSDQRVSRLESIGFVWNVKKGGNDGSLEEDSASSGASSNSDTRPDPPKHKIDLEADLMPRDFHKRQKPNNYVAYAISGIPIGAVDFLQRLPPDGR
jgi:hypothetical protein